MKYYQHHIGDFKKDTSYLSHEERSIYLEMLWLYYDEEKPLPKDIELIAFKVQSTVEKVKLLLSLYFDEDDECYRHKRIDAELNAIFNKSESARRSAKARWDNDSMRTHDERNANAMRIDATHNPLPITHNPIYNTYVRFEEFWNTLLPKRRVNKKGCLEKWKKHNLDTESDNILSWLKQMNMTKEWKEGFNPSPEVIINQRRWEDGVVKPVMKGRVL